MTKTTTMMTSETTWTNVPTEVVKAEEVSIDFLDKQETIILSLKVQNQLKFLINKYPSIEWMAAIIGKKDEEGWFAEELYIMDQEVNFGATTPTPRGDKELNSLKNKIGWIHSHHTMKAYFSPTDWETAAMHDVSMCINNSYEFFAICRVDVDCEHSNAHGKKLLKPLQVLFEPDLTVEEEENLEQICNKKIKQNQPSTSWNGPKKYNNVTQQWEPLTPPTKILQPNMLEKFAGAVKRMENNSTRILNFMEARKPKQLRKYGHIWECAICPELIGTTPSEVVYSIFHESYAHVMCLEDYVKDDSVPVNVGDQQPWVQ